jgi:hypothetical protein
MTPPKPKSKKELVLQALAALGADAGLREAQEWAKKTYKESFPPTAYFEVKEEMSKRLAAVAASKPAAVMSPTVPPVPPTAPPSPPAPPTVPPSPAGGPFLAQLQEVMDAARTLVRVCGSKEEAVKAVHLFGG